MKKGFWILTVCIQIVSCGKMQEKLPILGNPAIEGNNLTYPKIRDFSFINQNGHTVTNETFAGKIYIADFIFLSCPTICPKMNSELKKVYDAYKNNTEVLFLSHTIDPENDTVEHLKLYTDNYGIKNNWHFVTGNKDSIYKMAKDSYFATAYPDSSEPGGYVHSGGFLLIDKNRHIRGVYDGTNQKETKRLIKDIKTLLEENQSK
ncbi:SCO family protein [Flavobacterium cheongpyeongense]|uniref:SCO family protein n=1 Tax=Flavobacterium cheongpyeongense TaxID=2212651 RepID=A0A2V4BST2_9FLAO|nr:SCO family protein [Flavobacterium cheongpyeongense]PXY42129.1 SCO family protein [Flavobacterium cheongpyeongense]